ncbi:MAG TPA: hypothetical protein VGI20_06965 [Rhizomicrobium sp.]
MEDAVARCADDARHVRALGEAESAAASSDNIARHQYAKGIVNFINVLNADRSLRTARDQLVQGRQPLAQDFGSLFKALGGGWDDPTVDSQMRPPEPDSR